MAVDENLLYVLTSAEVGVGEADLGAKLTELHLKVLADAEIRPARIIFLNSAVFLTTEGTPYLDVLLRLQEGGTELVSCITCLSYHARRDRLVVGREGDMKDTVTAMTEAGRVVTL